MIEEILQRGPLRKPPKRQRCGSTVAEICGSHRQTPFSIAPRLPPADRALISWRLPLPPAARRARRRFPSLATMCRRTSPSCRRPCSRPPRRCSRRNLHGGLATFSLVGCAPTRRGAPDAPAVVYSLLFVLFRRNQPSGPSSYRWALLGTILSYAIVVYKAHVNAYIRSLSSGTNKNLATVAQGLVKDENAQYMLLAIMWYLNPAYTRGFRGGRDASNSTEPSQTR